ncbi:MAG: 4,5-DOPA dioxygenase extradiol [Negativicutes bacterium]|nr:4,5-DOPA dioxygenase extradiol [Negativicutes bacterium]
MSKKMPVVFIGHGSPQNITADNDYTAALVALGRQLPRPKAIMVVSAHWLTKGTQVCYAQKPKTIYDFFGFPRELYQVSYPCPGAPAWAETVRSTVRHTAIRRDDDWGLDHAAWAVLHHMYPEADIPVFEMSLDYSQPGQYHYDLAAELAPLREQGVLILGSGNIVHNLRTADFANMAAEPPTWATAFDLAVKTALVSGDHQRLIDYHHLPEAALAIPTNEHYLPLLYTLALKTANDRLDFIHESIQNATVSMRSLIITD